MMNRRTFLASASTALLAHRRAANTEENRRRPRLVLAGSHADVVIGKYLEGYNQDDRATLSALEDRRHVHRACDTKAPLTALPDFFGVSFAVVLRVNQQLTEPERYVCGNDPRAPGLDMTVFAQELPENSSTACKSHRCRTHATCGGGHFRPARSPGSRGRLPQRSWSPVVGR